MHGLFQEEFFFQEQDTLGVLSSNLIFEISRQI